MQRWPLPPKPGQYETLRDYLHRLAECYGVNYNYFCRKALIMSPSELQKFRPNDPTLEILQRLSNGTGISIRRLKLMTISMIWRRLMKE
jgi:hypothetical protein